VRQITAFFQISARLLAMRENQTQYRFRRRTASQFGVQNAVLAGNEKRRHEVGVWLLDVAGAAGQV
jgi:hypothetical protein